jgi:TonB-dependent receptor
MRSFVRRTGVHTVVYAAVAFALTAASATAARAQAGTISGRIADSAGTPLAASVTLTGASPLGAYAGPDGRFEISGVPAGTHRMITHYLGFLNDTTDITVEAGRTVRHNVVLRQNSRTLSTVVVNSARLNETISGALQEQKDADNIISVMSGDEIRALPNANAAEALARMPGVTAERDEGEGKYVEIRGTPPEFQLVTIDGAYVPGTLGHDVRAVKLDDVPADILGAIEVSKTLLADMDAAAIGGSVNLVTKVPEGAPHGYVFGQYSYQDLESKSNGQGTLTYGGRVGPEKKFGFLFSGSYDRTNRTINDVEPSYTADNLGPSGYVQQPNGGGFTHYFPSGWSQREYDYYRTRYGLAGDLDYRASATSSFFVKGLWSAFFDQANRWETQIDGSKGTDVVSGPNGQGQIQGANVLEQTSNRGPIEHTWGFTGGGKHQFGSVKFDWGGNYSGSTATTHNHYDDTYNGPQGFNYNYNQNKTTPQYSLPPGSPSLTDGNNYSLNDIQGDNELTNGQVVGAKFNVLIPFTIGELPAAFKFGAKYQNEHKGYLSDQPDYLYNGASPLLLSGFQSSYIAPNFYGHICPGCYPNAPFGNIPALQQYFHSVGGAGGGMFVVDPGSAAADLEATYAGTEQVTAVYGMQTLDVKALHINVGLRAEQTTVGYVGHGPTSTNPDSEGTSIATIRGGHSYIDFFPSVQLRYALDDNTNLRGVISRGISRPNYPDLAPHFNAIGATAGSVSSPLSDGNPNLQPEYAWNYDLLFEHYFSTVGVFSAGAFYKDIKEFIFDRTVPYTGSVGTYAEQGYFVSQPQNGPSAHLWGAEFDYQQHLAFLPGLLKGIGFDVNWTHVESKALVPQDTTVSYTDANGNTQFPYKGQPFRHAQLPRQFPNMFNVAFLYDYSPVTFRLAGQYTAASLFAYNQDGTSNPQSGDIYNYPHWQVDGELQVLLFGHTSVQVQGLNINNAVFGFFTGLPGNGHSYNNQREYYGPTISVGVRQGF